MIKLNYIKYDIDEDKLTEQSQVEYMKYKYDCDEYVAK